MQRTIKAAYFDAAVTAVWTGGAHAVVEMTAPAEMANLDPGQFVMACCDARPEDRPPEPLVSRPFSVSDVRMEGGTARFRLLLKAIGRGTRWLAERRPGDTVRCFGPLGAGLGDAARVRRTVIVIGGGSGIAPLPIFARRLVPAGRRVIAVAGANVLADLPLEADWRQWTSDGASTTGSAYLRDALEPLGAEFHAALLEDRNGYFRGTAIDAARGLLAALDPGETTLIACGPWGMMRAGHELAAATGAQSLVLLESMMACGFGVCRSCVCEGLRGGERVNKTVCTDGPLFDSSEIVWS